MMTLSHQESQLRPLTKIHSKTKEVYTRPAAITAEIEAVLQWPLHDAFSLASQHKLKPQTLVYLLRNFQPNRPTQQYNSMVVAFFSRVERAGCSFVKDLAQNEQERVHGEVKDMILRLWGTEAMDAFELSFKKVVDRLYMTAYDKISLRLRTEIPWEDLYDRESGETGEDFAEALGLSHRGPSAPLAEVKTELAQIMELLSPKERDAVIYVHHLRMTELEAAEQMGCTDRNVRHLLKKAREKAQGKQWKGAQNCA